MCGGEKYIYSGNPEYELIDIGKNVRDLKEFLVLRDHHKSFEKVRSNGNIGIPCFVKEDGSVIISLDKFDESYIPEYTSGAACRLDGTGC